MGHISVPPLPSPIQFLSPPPHHPSHLSDEELPLLGRLVRAAHPATLHHRVAAAPPAPAAAAAAPSRHHTHAVPPTAPSAHHPASSAHHRGGGRHHACTGHAHAATPHSGMCHAAHALLLHSSHALHKKGRSDDKPLVNDVPKLPHATSS